MRNNNIGLIIQGCKGGHRVLCSNDVVDYKEQSIAGTIVDLRTFVRFNRNNLTTYAIEFTDRYKVYSIQRTLNDNGTGAFVAIMLFVPHEERLENARLLLDNMMDDYFKEYVHPVFGTYNPGKYDDITPFNDLLSSANVAKENYVIRQASRLDEPARLRIYEDISEVDRFFNEPYRPEFWACRKVIFMDRSMYENREGGETGEKVLTFNTQPTLIHKVSDPQKSPILILAGHNVASLSVNGESRDPGRPQPVRKTDQVAIVVRPSDERYYQNTSISGPISSLIAQRILKENAATMEITLTDVPFKPKPMRLEVKREDGLPLRNSQVELRNSRDKEMSAQIVQDNFTGKAYASIPGDCVDDLWDALVTPIAGVHQIVCDKNVSLKQLIDEGLPYVVRLKDHQIQIKKLDNVCDSFIKGKSPDGLQFKLRVKDVSIPHTITLPTNVDIADIEYTPEYPERTRIERISSTELKLVPIQDEYVVEIPNGDYWDFKVGTKSRKKDSARGYAIWLYPDEKPEDGQLTINGKKRKFDCIGNTITPKEEETTPPPFPQDNVWHQDNTGSGNSSAGNTDTGNSGLSGREPMRLEFEGFAGPGFTYKKKYTTGIKAKQNKNKSGQRVQLDNGVIDFDCEYVSIYKKGVLLGNVYADSSTSKSDDLRNVPGYEVEYFGNRCRVTSKKRPAKISWRKIALASALVLLLAAVCFLVARLFTQKSEEIGKRPFTISDYNVSDGDEATLVEVPIEKITGGNNYVKILDNKGDKVYTLYIYSNNKGEKGLDNYRKALAQEFTIQVDGKNTITYQLPQEDIDEYVKWDKKDNFDTKAVELKTKNADLYEEYLENKPMPYERVRDRILNQINGNDRLQNLILKDLAEDNDFDSDEFLEVFDGFSGQIAYITVQEEDIAKKEAAANVEALKRSAQSYKGLLWADNCTMANVTAVERWWNSLSAEEQKDCTPVYNFAAAIPAYQKFFKATTLDNIKAVQPKSLFSEKQQAVMYYYTTGTTDFKNLKGIYGIDFAGPISAGYGVKP